MSCQRWKTTNWNSSLLGTVSFCKVWHDSCIKLRMNSLEKEILINKAANWLYEHLANSDRMPMANWNKEFWMTAFVGYMNDDTKA